jgi:hypothetical protein
MQDMGKVTPEAMMLIYLDEIAGRLGELQEKLIPTGKMQALVLAVTDQPQLIGGSDWMSATIRNDSEDYNIYLFDDFQFPRPGYDAPIKPGEALLVDFRSRTGGWKYIVCAAGETAAARIFRQW